MLGESFSSTGKQKINGVEYGVMLEKSLLRALRQRISFQQHSGPKHTVHRDLKSSFKIELHKTISIQFDPLCLSYYANEDEGKKSDGRAGRDLPQQTMVQGLNAN
ncbi:hypothetical protein AMECASPLE_009117, partial [Ameca splendens]